MVQPGQVLAGKFQVERVLGQGGMGVVVSAYHLVLGQRVALKFLLPEAMQHGEAVERFLREARAAVRLKSEHVGRVIDVGTLENGAPYIVMEYLEGTDLSGYVQQTGPMPVPQAVDFLLQACEAIAEAHALGIVHRDLKPANLFITRAPDGAPLVKVLDFGISKAATSDQDFNLTRTSAVMGSPGYMSPEQLRSTRDVDARSDIWALGVILYELTSGRQPFVAESITELALKVAMDPLPPLYLPAMPSGFDQVVGCCLEKDPNRRFGNVAELAAALVPFGPPNAHEAAERIARVLRVPLPAPVGGYHGATVRAPTSGGPGTGPITYGTPTTLSSAAGQTSMSPGKRRTGLFVGIGVAVVAGAVAAVVAASGGKGGSATPAAASDGSAAAAPAPAAGSAQPVAPAPEKPVVAQPTAPAADTAAAVKDGAGSAVKADPAANGAGSAAAAAKDEGKAAEAGSGAGAGSAAVAAHEPALHASHHHGHHATAHETTKPTKPTKPGSGSGSDDFANSRY